MWANARITIANARIPCVSCHASYESRRRRRSTDSNTRPNSSTTADTANRARHGAVNTLSSGRYFGVF